MPGSSPFALAIPAFPFRALVLLAGRAPMGGPRETALATFIAARLAAGAAPPVRLAAPVRAERAAAARLWMTSVALPAPVRAVLLKVVDASARDDQRALAASLARVTDITAPYLDRGARLELEQLASRLAT